MSFWSRVSRWLGPKIPPPAIQLPQMAALELTIPAALRGDGSFPLPIVGESQYQTALNRICGGRRREGHDLVMVASLVLEDTNPHDPMAVRVAIQGLTVGYLTRDKARKYRNRLSSLGHAHIEATCRARIRGGWNRGGDDVGNYGVQLDVDLRKPGRRGP